VRRRVVGGNATHSSPVSGGQQMQHKPQNGASARHVAAAQQQTKEAYNRKRSPAGNKPSERGHRKGGNTPTGRKTIGNRQAMQRENQQAQKSEIGKTGTCAPNRRPGGRRGQGNGAPKANGMRVGPPRADEKGVAVYAHSSAGGKATACPTGHAEVPLPPAQTQPDARTTKNACPGHNGAASPSEQREGNYRQNGEHARLRHDTGEVAEELEDIETPLTPTTDNEDQGEQQRQRGAGKGRGRGARRGALPGT
jgi:hypothetical protein